MNRSIDPYEIQEQQARNKDMLATMIKKIMTARLYDYQWDMILKAPTFSIVRKSRRIGYSYLTAFEGLLNAHMYRKYTRQFVSYNLDDAKEKIREAQEIYYDLPLGIRKKLVSESKTTLEFLDDDGKSVSRLISLPCRPPRGKGGDIILDEFAFYQNPEKIYTAALPSLVGGEKNREDLVYYRLQIGSTTFGSSNMFKRVYSDRDRYPDYLRLDVYWWECPRLCVNIENAKIIAPTLSTEERVRRFGNAILNEIYQNMTLEEFLQEYELAFLEDVDAYIPWDWINNASQIDEWYRTVDELLSSDEHDLFMGVDIGRTNHATEIVLMKKENGRFKMICMLTYKQTEFAQQEQVLSQILASKKVIRACFDNTGLGMNLVENVGRKFRHIVEGVTFTPESKTKLSNELYICFERGNIEIIRHRDLMLQINSIKKTYTSTSRYPRFDVEANDKHHADKYWAVALSVYAGTNVDAFSKTKTLYQNMKQKQDDTKQEVILKHQVPDHYKVKQGITVSKCDSDY